MTRVKICGLTRSADVDAAVTAGADAVGVIVDVPVDTPREVSAERAATLFDRVPPFVTGTLVTMGEDPSTIAGLADLVGADAVQVHGDLPPGDVSYLAARTDVPVIRVVDAAEPEEASRYAPVSDALLVDSVDDEGAGGTGETHDWTATRTLVERLDVPIILAGGLTPANVSDAVQAVDPFAVDVASGVEASGGVKDHDALEAFVTAATREPVRP
jgi:phosphoribosylanthranilate isomerase